MKKGTKVIVTNYYHNTELRGKKGTVLRILHDKDCTYAQHEHASVLFENNVNHIIPTLFLIEEK